MNREIKFRAYLSKKKIMVQPCYLEIFKDGSLAVGENNNWINSYDASGENIMQYTGLKDKNGKEIYEGDIVRCNKPYRTTQTHEGDNIPNGSYTEPMEPGIKTIDYEVKFIDGTFCLYGEDDLYYDNIPTPISWGNTEWDLETIKEAISWTRQDAGWFDDPEEGDLQYLISDVAKVENVEQLIKHLSGLEIIGNVFENPK